MTPTVLGLDLSLAGTGAATRVSTWRHKTRGQEGDTYAERMTRIIGVRTWVIDQVRQVGPHLIVIEGPAPNATARVSSWDRAKLWWDVLEHAGLQGIHVAVAPPPSVKKYATGNGNCKKDEMIAAAYKRLLVAGIQPANADEADAAWLMAMGYDWLGSPLADLPKIQGAALAGVAWPKREGDLAA